MRSIPGTMTRVFLSVSCALSLISPTPAGASAPRPDSSEPAASGRRVASRALERSTSTQWPSDVAERLRLLEEHAERAARDRAGTSATGAPR